MGNRDIWKISLQPSNTSNYQGNMYTLIATESARKFDLVLHSLSVSGTCSFCTFLIIQLFESTLLRLPCAPGKFEMSRHCREEDDDGGGPATKVPRESIDNHSTRRQTWSSLPVLDLEKCLLCDSRSCWSHEALTRCTLDSQATTTILLTAARIRKDDVCSLRSTSRQTFIRRKWCTMPLATMCYRKYTRTFHIPVFNWRPLLTEILDPPVLESIAIANKENAQNPSDHSTTEPNDSYQTWYGLQTSCLRINDQGVDHWWCLLYYESIKPHCAIWLNAPPWIWCGPNSRWCIQPEAKVTWVSLKRQTSAHNMPILCQQKDLYHMYGKLLRNEVQEKNVREYSLKSLSHMIKRHFDVRLVFHRPNKCIESQYVFSSEVQPGQLLRDVWGWTRHKKE